MNIVEIIKACGENGVTRFKNGDVEIDFSGVIIREEIPYSKEVEQYENKNIVDPKLNEQVKYEQTSDEIESLIVTDPVEYERQMFGDELEDSETHEEN